jgi:type III secretion protein L
MLIWLHDAPAGAGAEDGIVRAAEVQQLGDVAAYRQALELQRDGVLQAAREEAAAIVERARSEAMALIEAARADAERAVAEGFRRGEREAVAAWHERVVQQAVDKADALNRTHAQLAAIVTAAVGRIIEAEPGEALYERALHSVKTLTRGATSLSLRVNAEDSQHARAAVRSFEGLGADGPPVEVSIDTALPRGSCIFESEHGILDASLPVQLDALRAAMERAVHRALAEPAADEELPGGEHHLMALDDDDGYTDDE